MSAAAPGAGSEEEEKEKGTGAVTHHRQLDVPLLQGLMSSLNLDIGKFVEEMYREDQELCGRRGRAFEHRMRSELGRLRSFEGYGPFSSWSPEEMAEAGLYFTGLKASVQCFCCGGVFCSTSVTKTPRSEHWRFEPDCAFLRGLDVGNVPKYAVRVRTPQSLPPGRREGLGDPDSRLETFSGWPFYAKVEPRRLAEAGFFHTGLRDKVQCFSCDGSLADWLEGDDPWMEHSKWFPECAYVRSVKSASEIDHYTRSYDGFPGVTAVHFLDSSDEDACPEGSDSWSDQEGSASVFAEERSRLESFHTWPPDVNGSPAELAKAGFFYRGVGDHIQCFCCGVQLCRWEEGDEAWTEHERHSPECPHLLKKPRASETHSDKERPRELTIQTPAEEPRHSDGSDCGGNLLRRLGQLEHLTELTIDLGSKSSRRVIEQMSEGIAKPCHLEKLVLSGINLEQDSSKLARVLREAPKLRIFRLKCNRVPEFEELIDALSTCSRLEELALDDFHLSSGEISALVASLVQFQNLKILKIPRHSFSQMEESETFARAVGSLGMLEELYLSRADGNITAAIPLAQQLENLPRLRALSVTKGLDDSSLVKLAEVAKSGHLSKLQTLDLSMNEELSDLGWRDFFLTLDNVGELRELNISRMYTNQMKPQPDTCRALVQCVSRLPSLVNISMLSWMLDSMDFNMFNAMKERHPQSRRLRLLQQWTLPFEPVVLPEG